LGGESGKLSEGEKSTIKKFQPWYLQGKMLSSSRSRRGGSGGKDTLEDSKDDRTGGERGGIGL